MTSQSHDRSNYLYEILQVFVELNWTALFAGFMCECRATLLKFSVQVGRLAGGWVRGCSKIVKSSSI